MYASGSLTSSPTRQNWGILPAALKAFAQRGLFLFGCKVRLERRVEVFLARPGGLSVTRVVGRVTSGQKSHRVGQAVGASGGVENAAGVGDLGASIGIDDGGPGNRGPELLLDSMESADMRGRSVSCPTPAGATTFCPGPVVAGRCRLDRCR